MQRAQRKQGRFAGTRSEKAGQRSGKRLGFSGRKEYFGRRVYDYLGEKYGYQFANKSRLAFSTVLSVLTRGFTS